MQYLLGHTSSVMVRRYSATYDSEQAAEAHASFSPAAQLAIVLAQPAASLGPHSTGIGLDLPAGLSQ